MSLNLSSSGNTSKVFYGIGAAILLFLVGLGVFAANGWLPRTDSVTGKKTGWFGTKLPENASSSWNPFAPPLPTATPQLSKEYIYAGSRLLAVEDANIGGGGLTGFEGDVVDGNGGPAGDGVVQANDVTAIRAAVLGTLVLVTSPNQWQRSDVNLPCGNGTIDAGDVTVVRNMVLGVTPSDTPACGPTEPPPSPPEAGSQLAENKETLTLNSIDSNIASPPADIRIRVNNAVGPRGQSVMIPVFMEMDRDETAVAFTLEYDAARFSNPRIALNNELPPSTVLSTNTNQVGRIGILLDAEVPLSTTPRELRIVFVTLDVRPTAATGQSLIRVTDSLARKSVSSSGARLLPAQYTGGTVSIIN
jgi:hypothetical protein